MYIIWEGESQGEHICLYFATKGPSKEVLLFGSAQCSKNISDRPINVALSTKKKEKVVSMLPRTN
jgi:hypothetical protein